MIGSFPVFNMEVMSIALYMENPISGSPLQIQFTRSFIFKVNSVSDLKVRWSVICCLLCIFNLFLFNDFLAIASAGQCISKFSCAESGSPRNHCMGSNSR